MKASLILALLVLGIGIAGGCHHHHHHGKGQCPPKLKECENRVAVILKDSEQKQTKCTQEIAEGKRHTDDCKRDADARITLVTGELSKVKDDLNKAREIVKDKENQLNECSRELADQKKRSDDCKRDADARIASINIELSQAKEDLNKAKESQEDKEKKCSEEIKNEKRRADDCKHDADAHIALVNKELSKAKEDLQKAKEGHHDKEKELDKCLKKEDKCQRDKEDNALSKSEIVALFQNVFNLQSDNLKDIVYDISEKLEEYKNEQHDTTYSFKYLIISFCLGGVAIVLLNLITLQFPSGHSSERKIWKKLD